MGDIFYLLSCKNKKQWISISRTTFLFDWQGGESLYMHSFRLASCCLSRLPPTWPELNFCRRHSQSFLLPRAPGHWNPLSLPQNCAHSVIWLLET